VAGGLGVQCHPRETASTRKSRDRIRCAGTFDMPLTSDLPATPSIPVRLNYIIDTGTPPVTYVDWPERAGEDIPARYETREVAMHDGRPVADRLRLDTHGFVFVTHRTAVKDFTDADARTRLYDAEIADLIKAQSGASEVIVFDHTIRIGDEAGREAAKARPPVRGVHNDFTERSGPQRMRNALGETEAERRMTGRWAIIQVWRPIRGDVLADPLAMCDARTIPAEGFIPFQRRYPHRTAETYHISYHPAHVWFYFPRMTRNEAIVFKVYDTRTDVAARFTAHTAFEDPTSPPDAPPRESIESRVFAFFD
jgi:hypothetical protein